MAQYQDLLEELDRIADELIKKAEESASSKASGKPQAPSAEAILRATKEHLERQSKKS